jgi:hypothetical protein
MVASLAKAAFGRASSKRWRSSTKAAHATTGAPAVSAAQATGSSIQAAISTTIPSGPRTRT